jgi:4'-phosphopantetheinyl transferase
LIADAAFPLNLSRQHKDVPSYLAFSFASNFPSLAEHLEQFLHPNEINYFRGLQFPLRQTSFLLGRHAAKQVLTAFFGEPDPTLIEVCTGIFCQPLVKYRSVEKPELTIAHCQDAAVAIACQTGHPVGVDLEYLDRKRSQVLEDQFTKVELQLLEPLHEKDEISFLLLWTAKEALSKALKCGLTVPFEVLEVKEVRQTAPGACAFSFKNFSQYQAHSWVEGLHILSIVLPRRTSLDMNPFKAMQGLALGEGEQGSKLI